MRYEYAWRWATVLMHMLVWVALAVWAHMTAGPYAFSSCWQIILIYLPPLGFLYLAVAFVSFAVVIASISRPHLRASKYFVVACHGLVLAAGMKASSLAAYAATGHVRCL